MYSVEHLQLESFEDLNMFVCECLRMYPTQMTTRKVTESTILGFTGIMFAGKIFARKW